MVVGAVPPGTFQQQGGVGRQYHEYLLCKYVSALGIWPRKVFAMLPPALKKVASEAPPGIITDVKNVVDKGVGMDMCMRINELRRKRCRPLAIRLRRFLQDCAHDSCH